VRIILGALDGVCLRASLRREGGATIAGDLRALLNRLLKPQLDARRAAAHRAGGNPRKRAGKETAA
jgi:hypothetical protein